MKYTGKYFVEPRPGTRAVSLCLLVCTAALVGLWNIIVLIQRLHLDRSNFHTHMFHPFYWGYIMWGLLYVWDGKVSQNCIASTSSSNDERSWQFEVTTLNHYCCYLVTCRFQMHMQSRNSFNSEFVVSLLIFIKHIWKCPSMCSEMCGRSSWVMTSCTSCTCTLSF